MKVTSRFQGQFTYMTAQLIMFAYSNGYYLTYGDAYAKTGHKEGSFHGKRLAIDLNAFGANTGKWFTETKDLEPLGIFWESIGGTWGGRFTNAKGEKDGNHFSLGE